jgi:hypothetical protein
MLLKQQIRENQKKQHQRFIPSDETNSPLQASVETASDMETSEVEFLNQKAKTL